MGPLDGSRLSFRGGWAALALAILLVLIYPLSIEQASWVSITGQFGWLAFTGLFFGALVANSKLSPVRATVLGGGVGAVFVVVFTALALGDGTLRTKLQHLAVNVNNWITAVASGEAGTDPTAFILFLGATCWAASFVGVFALQRYGRPWDLLLFTGFSLVVNISLALRPLSFDLVGYSIIALLLLVRLHVANLEERWLVKNIVPAGDMSWRVLRGGLTWTFALILLATFAPRVGAAETFGRAWNTFETPWHSVENEWQRLFAGVYGPSRIQGVSFSDVIRLGLAPNLGDRLVMYVTSPESRFWRATAYDFYTGVGWKSTDGGSLDKTEALALSARKKVEITVEPVTTRGNLLFGPNEPVTASVPRTFNYGDDRTFSSSMRAREKGQASSKYAVTAAVSTATKEALRAAGANYPPGIIERYVQLPSSIPQRVRDLARRITAGKQTPYEKAEAIETYLRSNYKYSTVVKPPPVGRDPVDWFLFDLREDFCEYFASAMTIMLRDLGIPARVVEGYTTGSFDSELGKYVVRESNAHAWVEAFFPGYGWVEFEPTPSELTFIRRDTESEQGDESTGGVLSGDRGERLNRGEMDLDTDEPPFADQDGSGGSLPRDIDPMPFALALLALVGTGLAGWLRFELRFRGIPAPEAAYGKMRLLASYVGLRQRPHQTTYEYAAMLSHALPRVRDEVATIARARALARYSRDGMNGASAHESARAWRLVARQLLRLAPRRVVRFIRSLA